jgi:hypothetical protein
MIVKTDGRSLPQRFHHKRKKNGGSNMLLRLNLQMFAAEGGEDDLDFDSMLEEFESEWSDEPEESEEQEQEQTEESDEQEEEVEESEETPDEEAPQADPKEELPQEDDKRNKAFAELRREAEANKKYAEFINRMAEDAGVKPEEILARYEERTLQQRSEREGVPVEYLKRQTETESELTSLKEQLVFERLDKQIKTVTEKYGAEEQDVQAAFEEMYRNGIDPTKSMNVDFEKFYKAANFDKILEAEVSKARQTELANKKKRQQSAAVPNGSSVSQTNGELSDDEVDSMLKQMGIRIE